MQQFTGEISFLLLVRLFLIRLRVLKPLEELLGTLADLARSLQVHVLLAGLAAPGLEVLLSSQVILINLEQNGTDRWNQVWLVNTDEPLNTTQESLLVAVRGDHLLQHSGTGVDLLNNTVVKDALCENSRSAVLGLDAKLLRLEVNVDVFDLGDTALLLSLGLDPLAKLLERVVSAFGVVAVLDDQCVLQILWQCLGTRLDGSLGHINRPLDLLLLDFSKFLGLGIDSPGKIIVAGVALVFNLVLNRVGATVARTAILLKSTIPLGFLARLAICLFGRLVLFALLWRVLQDVSRELVAQVGLADLATRLAVEKNLAILDIDHSLRVLAFLAQHELVDETVQIILQLASLVGAIDDPAIILGVDVGLGAKLEAEVFDHIVWWTSELICDLAQVHNDGFDAVAFAFHLGLDFLHLVAVEGVSDIATDVDVGHDCGSGWLNLVGEVVWRDRSSLQGERPTRHAVDRSQRVLPLSYVAGNGRGERRDVGGGVQVSDSRS